MLISQIVNKMNQQGEESDEEASFGCSEDHEESEVNSPESEYFILFVKIPPGKS